MISTDLQILASEQIEGRYISLAQGGRVILVVGSVGGRWPRRTLCRGRARVYYGLPLLSELDYLMPVLCRDDFRREYHGMEALRFAIEQGAAFPRGDIAGVRISTGIAEMLFLRQIDMGRPTAAFVGGVPISDAPMHRIHAVVWAGSVKTGWERAEKPDLRFPDPLCRYVPCFMLDPVRARELPDLLESTLA